MYVTSAARFIRKTSISVALSHTDHCTLQDIRKTKTSAFFSFKSALRFTVPPGLRTAGGEDFCSDYLKVCDNFQPMILAVFVISHFVRYVRCTELFLYCSVLVVSFHSTEHI